ncbi:MAG: aminoacyl-tRNA deacylase [Candidatus Diapherotrites archaeon]|uniref:Aminoacyl-tRNA deacylase n=1 Tax=Candidatus Iainarchaeum sp. TaxID=3101447 RepID=A0A8T4L5K3_9ARCH|nr:aminoacyl-tRNA deacylase [Candidatus Diapherotrites archaeon]
MGAREAEQVQAYLKGLGMEFRVVTHEAVYTSEAAAKARGLELKQGVKAMVLKDENGKVVLGLIAADKRIDLKKLAAVAGTGRLSLAKPDEVLKHTGCEVGSVHPFGNLHKLPTYLDESVKENETVDFNIGLHTHSVIMTAKDFVDAVKPVEGRFSAGARKA